MKIVAYYASWSVYTRCKIDEINPKLCTHLIYAFAGLNDDATIRVNDPYGDVTAGGYKKFTGLKKTAPSLKTLISIGGYSEGTERFSKIASDPSLTKTLCKNLFKFLEKYGFDGVDIDWEHPTPLQKTIFTNFLQTVSLQLSLRGYLVTVAVGASKWFTNSCNVPEISKYVSQIHLMTYDMSSSKNGRTGANAPLYSTDENNVECCVKAWLEAGAPREKLILGISAFGKQFTLCNPDHNGVGDLAVIPKTETDDNITYTEILSKYNWPRHWNESQQIPYICRGQNWIGYDDPLSVSAKVEFAEKLRLSGVMLWTLDADNPRGEHDEDSFPLLKIMSSYM